jgi:hypothetical protein
MAFLPPGCFAKVQLKSPAERDRPRGVVAPQ